MEILPKLDNEVLQQKANEYAMKGAEESLKEFYTGYDSPYKKAIEENLKTKGVDSNFDIPDIIGVLNDKFTKEIDQIANQAIAKSFIPLVKNFLIRENHEIKFSDILKKFIDRTNFEYNQKYNDADREDFSCEEVQEDRKYNSFVSYRITDGKIGYELRFYKKDENTTTILSLPPKLDDRGNYYDRSDVREKMTVSLDGVSLELPFTRGILEDDFLSYIARLVIGNNNIIFDCTDFDDDMFPYDDHCHCD